jgi:hypothetical protein
MDEHKFEEKNDEPLEQLPTMPKVPIPIEGYVIYSQVALDIDSHFKIGADRQTALNLAMAKAIITGKLRSYDAGTGLPCDLGESSPYVRPDDIEAWLKSIGYPLKWDRSCLVNPEERNRGYGSDKRWDDHLIGKLIERRRVLKAQGIKNPATQAAEEFGISARLARQLIQDYKERSAKIKDPSKWVKKAEGLPVTIPSCVS